VKKKKKILSHSISKQKTLTKNIIQDILPSQNILPIYKKIKMHRL